MLLGFIAPQLSQLLTHINPSGEVGLPAGVCPQRLGIFYLPFLAHIIERCRGIMRKRLFYLLREDHLALVILRSLDADAF